MPETSPTGTPVIPPKAVPYLTALVGLAAAGVASLPPNTIGWKICFGITTVGSLLGIVSPGLRKRPE